MKIGDNVICIKDNKIIPTGELNNIKNKIYKIVDVENFVYSVNGEIRKTSFYNNTFNNYFIPLKQNRKDKINKINESNL